MTVPASGNVELCYFARVPSTTPFMLGTVQLVQKGAKGGTQPQHGLVYVYTGSALAGFPTGKTWLSRGCLDPGPDDRDHRVLVASGAARKVVRALPGGVALALPAVSDAPGGAPAGIGILVDINWANTDTLPRTVSTKLTLHRAAPARTRRVAQLLSDRSADAGIFVPPFTRHSTAELVDARWTAPHDSCVLGLSGQMHRRGRCIGVDLLDTSGQVKTPVSGIANPCEPDRRTQLFVGIDFTDPGSLPVTTPMPVRQGESLRYACWTDNGSASTSVRLGCETNPGTVPGAIGMPAAECSTALPSSPECPDNAACVFANAVAGPDVDDEACGLTALVYDAAADGGCDVSGLPR